ncbi:hypothetical protein GCM10027414_20320 [Humibacter ginsengiterrae]
MSDPVSRPRPQYGEYATPEEQRAAIKAPETNPHYAPPDEHPAYAPQASPLHPDAAERFTPPQQPDAERPSDAPAVLRHPADRVVTIALLVLGLFNVITTIAGRDGIAGQIDSAYHSMGLTGDYVVTPLSGTVADVVAIAFLALWVVAAGLSSWAMLRGRIAFWIPLAAGVLASLVNVVGYLILFLHDPTFLAYMQHL